MQIKTTNIADGYILVTLKPATLFPQTICHAAAVENEQNNCQLNCQPNKPEVDGFFWETCENPRPAPQRVPLKSEPMVAA